MTCVGSALGSAQFLQLLVSYLPYPFKFAGNGNHWDSWLNPHIPTWAMVTDPESASHFYTGHSSLYNKGNYIPWLKPLSFWLIFLMVLLSTLLCVNTLLRRQWTANERLSYPAVYLPLEMISGPSFWHNRGLWMGFAIAGLLTLWNGIAYLKPSFPMIPVKRQDISPFFSTPPWNSIGTLQSSFYFFAIGIAFLMPLDLSLSLWIFYLLFKLELVVVAAQGFETAGNSIGGFDNGAPYENSQAFGAYMAVFAITISAARPYLKDVWRTAFTKGAGPLDDSAEPMRYRTAILGCATGVGILSTLTCLLGMSPIIAPFFFAIYLILSIMITRIRAEFGFPVHDMSNMSPMFLLSTALGTRALGPGNISAFSMTYWFNRTYFAHPMPHQMEAMKLTDSCRSSQREMLRALVLAGFVGAIAIFWAYLHTAYIRGAGTARVEQWPRSFPNENFEQAYKWIKNPSGTNFPSLNAVGGGFLFAVLLGVLRLRLPWFPFHPLAYAVANSWGMQQIWMPVMIGSIAKMVLLRYGGLKTYRSAIPFFLGLILGEMIMGCLWTLYGFAIDARTYDFWP